MLFLKTSIMFFYLILGKTEDPVKPYVSSYIEKYKYVAIDEMVEYGIPASIIMAQAIIESNAGTSLLARKTNNHFGIKCKDYWDGGRYHHPDDDRDAQGRLIPSCFRAYASIEDSFADHSTFLMQTENYRYLFSYDKTEYREWAEGLELSGYATDEKYAEKLIRTIELYNLNELDYYTIQYIEKSGISSQHGNAGSN